MAPRLLIIDDEETLLFLYQLILEPEGYDLHLVSSGSAPMMMLDHALPDLIIVDYHMGGSARNVPLWQQLKADPSTSALPLILCTADMIILAEQTDLLREAGVYVVRKPFSISVFLDIVQQALQGSSTFPRVE